MKLFGSKSISSFFHYISKFGYYYAVCFLGFISIAFTLGLVSLWLGWENPFVSLSFEENFNLEIKPLRLFIKGEAGLPFMIPVIVIGMMAFYILVLYHLAKLFKVFMSEQIFKEDAIHHLSSLAFTFTAAAILSFGLMFSAPHDDSDMLLGFILLAISPLLFFIREVFKRGVFIQDDVNHTI